VYTSSTLALAALEMLVHLDPEEASREYVAVSAEIPPTVRIAQLPPSDLPRSWRDHPAPPELAELGMRWVGRGETAVLAVPSAVIPQEPNYLLNPRHPAFKRIRVGKAEPFGFDPRLWKG
jgi:RES domain-containing protein